MKLLTVGSKGGKRLKKKPLSKGKKGLLIFALILYVIFAVTRYSKDTTYIPFTGRIFDIEVTEETRIRATIGGTDVIWEGEDAAEIAELLNSIRYWWWYPENPVPHGGWDYAFVVNGEWYEASPKGKAIQANGIWYQLRGAPLKDVYDQLLEELRVQMLLEEQQREDPLNWE